MVSIVIPAYNAERFLEEALCSVASQSYPDWEAIIVDDGSTDTTPAIVERFAAQDPRFRLISTPNRGVSAARNEGLRHVNSEFFTFMDADDLLHPEFLSLLLTEQQRSDADIVFGGIDFYKRKYKIEKIPEELKAEYYTSAESIELAMYQTGMDNCVWGKLYRTSLWEGLEFIEGERYEDLNVFYRPIAKARKIAALSVLLYGYRQHEDSYIHKFAMARTDVLAVTDRMVRWAEENMPEVLPAARDRRMSAHFNILLLMIKNRVKAPEVRRRCIEVIKGQCRESAHNPKVRLKNRLAARLACLIL